MSVTTPAESSSLATAVAHGAHSHDLRVSDDLLVAKHPVDDSVRRWLLERLLEGAGHPGTLHLTMPVPKGEAEALLDLLEPNGSLAHGLFWHPSTGPAVAGLGAAHRIRLQGAERFKQLEERAADVWQGLHSETFPGSPGSTPRLFGGFSFAVGAAAEEPWLGFGDGCFTLPRWTYRRTGDGATLSLAVRGEEILEGSARQSLLDELQRIVEGLGAPTPLAPLPPRVLEIQRSPRGRFRNQVANIVEAIAQGDVDKIVAARRSRVTLGSALETGDMLRRLSRGLRASTRFAFVHDGATFLGATPERLVSRRGEAISTEALAGSIASGGEHATQLLSSGKDRQEHQLVVDEIVRCLGPLCDGLEAASEPRIRELREVLHLHTPIRGRLAEPYHVLDLVERLHPTPAVGGVPTAKALEWIIEHEDDPRGWYAAPVGWFDAAGDGDFSVALRSCVLRGSEAFLYAGAGIVRDSDPELEAEETDLKKQALLTALGSREIP